jgi:hypothetical protein
LAPAYLLGFVDVLARHPLPLGRTGPERRRIAQVVVRPAGPSETSGEKPIRRITEKSIGIRPRPR